MRTRRNRKPLGANWREEISAFGDKEYRAHWRDCVEALVTLKEAVAALTGFRADHEASVSDLDALWIEARLEDRVAVLRFGERSYEDLRTKTLTDESIAAVQAHYETIAETGDAPALEAAAAEFRLKYKPPIMPSSPFLKIEVVLSEALMKRRSLDWFEPTIGTLRAGRDVKVLKEGWPDPASAAHGTQ